METFDYYYVVEDQILSTGSSITINDISDYTGTSPYDRNNGRPRFHEIIELCLNKGPRID